MGTFLSKTIKIERTSWGFVHTGQTFCSLEISAGQNDFPQGCPSPLGCRFPEGCPRWAQPPTLDGKFSASTLYLLSLHPPRMYAGSSGHPGPLMPSAIAVSWAKHVPPLHLWCPVPSESRWETPGKLFNDTPLTKLTSRGVLSPQQST